MNALKRREDLIALDLFAHTQQAKVNVFDALVSKRPYKEKGRIKMHFRKY
ncbi:MAG: hypothetical protein ACI9N3_001103 [Colwellia sp.]|jgi:hypothetical protein